MLPETYTFPFFLNSKIIGQFYASGPTEPRHIMVYCSGLFHPRPISARIFHMADFFFCVSIRLGFESTKAVSPVRF